MPESRCSRPAKPDEGWRRTYDGNYLDARNQPGKTLADRLFPALITRSKPDNTSEEAEVAA